MFAQRLIAKEQLRSDLEAMAQPGLLDRPWTSRHPLWCECIFPSKALPLSVIGRIAQYF